MNASVRNRPNFFYRRAASLKFKSTWYWSQSKSSSIPLSLLLPAPSFNNLQSHFLNMLKTNTQKQYSQKKVHVENIPFVIIQVHGSVQHTGISGTPQFLHSINLRQSIKKKYTQMNLSLQASKFNLGLSSQVFRPSPSSSSSSPRENCHSPSS